MHSSLIKCVSSLGDTRWVDPSTGLVYNEKNRKVQHSVRWSEQFKGYVTLNGAMVYSPCRDSTPDPKSDGVDSENPRGAGLKYDGDKPRWSLLMQGFPRALAGIADALTFGAKKYAAHSWRNVENGKERYRDALYRHLNAIESGEETDPESGLSHWDHIGFNALALSELHKDKPNA